MKKTLALLVWSLLITLAVSPVANAQERTVGRQSQGTEDRDLNGLTSFLETKIESIDAAMEALSRSIYVNEQFKTGLTSSAECPAGQYAYRISELQIDGDEFVSGGRISCIDAPVRYVTASSNTYAWDKGSWSACSETCGGGTQTRSVVCRDQSSSAVVSDSNCSGTKPSASRACNTQACVDPTPLSMCWQHPDPYKVCLKNGPCSTLMESRTTKCHDENGNFQAGHTVYCAVPDTPEDCAVSVKAPVCIDKIIKFDDGKPYPADLQFFDDPRCPCGALTGAQYRNSIRCRQPGFNPPTTRLN